MKWAFFTVAFQLIGLQSTEAGICQWAMERMGFLSKYQEAQLRDRLIEHSDWYDLKPKEIEAALRSPDLWSTDFSRQFIDFALGIHTERQERALIASKSPKDFKRIILEMEKVYSGISFRINRDIETLKFKSDEIESFDKMAEAVKIAEIARTQPGMVDSHFYIEWRYAYALVLDAISRLQLRESGRQMDETIAELVEVLNNSKP